MRKHKLYYKGFTLIELIVVLLIVGILLSVGAVQYSSAVSDSKKAAFQSAVLNALSAAESYRQKYGEYPSTATLNALFNDTAYFTTRPLNPYTGQTLQATVDQSLGASSKLGYFYYNVKADGSIDVVTNPAIDINLASGTGGVGGSLPNYTITFTVKSSSGSAISGAQIMIGGRTVNTNTSGNASVTLPKGSFFYSVSKDGYNFYTGNINLTGNTPITVTLSPKTYTVTIFITDANTGKPISGAVVSGIGSGGTTDPNGRLTLTNVEAKSYTAQVSAVGYINTSKAIAVNNNQQVNITLSRASCTITFNITNGAGALVQLSDGSALNLNSSGGGSVSKPCGEYSYTISKEGYNALSGSIEALSDFTVRGVMASTGGSLVVGEGEIVEIAVIFSPLADRFKDLYKNNPNRGIVAYSVSSGTYQISLLNVAKTVYDYAVAFRPIAMQVVAIGAGGDYIHNAAGIKGGGSGYLSWANVTTLPDNNATLTVNVNVGGPGHDVDGQPTTVSIPPYVSTVTANGGKTAYLMQTPYGQNNGYEAYFGTGCSAGAVGNGTSAAYVYPGALAIWQELAQTPVFGNGVGGGGGKDKTNGYLHYAQPGGVFLLIRGVVYY